MRPAARLLLLFAIAALAVGAGLELAGLQGRSAALVVAAVALAGVCVLAASQEGGSA